MYLRVAIFSLPFRQKRALQALEHAARPAPRRYSFITWHTQACPPNTGPKSAVEVHMLLHRAGQVIGKAVTVYPNLLNQFVREQTEF